MINLFSFFFFNDTATTEIYTLSLHDALPIYSQSAVPSTTPANAIGVLGRRGVFAGVGALLLVACIDRKSTRLNSSHGSISYAVFCLKKKKNKTDKPVISISNTNDTRRKNMTE